VDIMFFLHAVNKKHIM